MRRRPLRRGGSGPRSLDRIRAFLHAHVLFIDRLRRGPRVRVRRHRRPLLREGVRPRNPVRWNEERRRELLESRRVPKRPLRRRRVYRCMLHGLVLWKRPSLRRFSGHRRVVAGRRPSLPTDKRHREHVAGPHLCDVERLRERRLPQGGVFAHRPRALHGPVLFFERVRHRDGASDFGLPPALQLRAPRRFIVGGRELPRGSERDGQAHR